MPAGDGSNQDDKKLVVSTYINSNAQYMGI